MKTMVWKFSRTKNDCSLFSISVSKRNEGSFFLKKLKTPFSLSNILSYSTPLSAFSERRQWMWKSWKLQMTVFRFHFLFLKKIGWSFFLKYNVIRKHKWWVGGTRGPVPRQFYFLVILEKAQKFLTNPSKFKHAKIQNTWYYISINKLI